MTDKESIISLVRKLLALSKSDNPHEASLAAEKAQTLLLKHNLELSHVETEEDSTDLIAREDFRAGDGVWQLQLASAVAKANMCRIVRTHERNPSTKPGAASWLKRYAIFGRPENIEVVKYLYAYLQREIKRLCEEATPLGADKSFAAAFRVGAAGIVAKRLHESLQTFKAASSDTMSLIVVNDAALTAQVETAFPNLTDAKSRGVSSSAGYYAGREAGANVQWRVGVKGPSERNAGGQLLLGGK